MRSVWTLVILIAVILVIIIILNFLHFIRYSSLAEGNNPVITPDGEYLAYRKDNSIGSINKDGTARQLLIELKDEPDDEKEFIFVPLWTTRSILENSIQDYRILFNSGVYGGPYQTATITLKSADPAINYEIIPPENRDVWKPFISSSGGHLTFIDTPTGAFESGQSDWDIKHMDRNTGTITDITPPDDGLWQKCPSVSNDGKILFLEWIDEIEVNSEPEIGEISHINIWKLICQSLPVSSDNDPENLDIIQSSKRKISDTSFEIDLSYPIISSAGNYAVYTSMGQLRIVDFTVNPIQCKTLVHDMLVLEPCISQNGQWISFKARMRADEAEGRYDHYHLFRIRSDGSGLKQITRGDAEITVAEGKPGISNNGDVVYMNDNKIIYADVYTILERLLGRS